jgi:hypothetical protein
METLPQRLKLNQSKYGMIFNTVLTYINQFNPFDLPLNVENNYPLMYIEMAEGFMHHLITEVSYHNYILMLDPSDHLYIITSCINKAIYLKDLDLYTLDTFKEQQLCVSLLYPISIYLTHFKNQVIKRINSDNNKMNDKIASSLPQPNQVNKLCQLPLFKIYQQARPPIIDKNGKIKICHNQSDLPI